jgi:hypothetical protein
MRFLERLGLSRLGLACVCLLALAIGGTAIQCSSSAPSTVEQVATTKSADTVNTFSSNAAANVVNKFATGASLNGKRFVVFPGTDNSHTVNVVSSPVPPAGAVPGADGGPDALPAAGPANGNVSPTSLVNWSLLPLSGNACPLSSCSVCGGGSC